MPAPPTTPISLKIPAGWPAPPINIFEYNSLTEEGFQLGRKLFYDGKLSKDGNFPCASCHQQFSAFSTFDHDFSHGFNNAFTTRNAPGLYNLAWMRELHWDGGINHIEVQPLAPLTAINEMAENIDSVLKKLKADPVYPGMFRLAFGDEIINSQRMLKAIAMFVGTITSSDSKYDQVKRGEATFTNAELAGYTVFKSKCVSCHTEPLFTDNSLRNNGLPLNTFLKDYGRMRITGSKSDSIKFKVPSLRNVNLTYPYMHDGRFSTLGQVLDHYSNGIQFGPTLDPLLSARIPLTTLEKNDLISFMFALTDNVLLNNPRFSQP